MCSYLRRTDHITHTDFALTPESNVKITRTMKCFDRFCAEKHHEMWCGTIFTSSILSIYQKLVRAAVIDFWPLEGRRHHGWHQNKSLNLTCLMFNRHQIRTNFYKALTHHMQKVLLGETQQSRWIVKERRHVFLL